MQSRLILILMQLEFCVGFGISSHILTSREKPCAQLWKSAIARRLSIFYRRASTNSAESKAPEGYRFGSINPARFRCEKLRIGESGFVAFPSCLQQESLTSGCLKLEGGAGYDFSSGLIF
jgi:hypothetical protein